jgi:hypothetical protein
MPSSRKLRESSCANSHRARWQARHARRRCAIACHVRRHAGAMAAPACARPPGAAAVAGTGSGDAVPLDWKKFSSGFSRERM